VRLHPVYVLGGHVLVEDRALFAKFAFRLGLHFLKKLGQIFVAGLDLIGDSRPIPARWARVALKSVAGPVHLPSLVV